MKAILKDDQIKPGTLCRHFNGNLYQILGVAEDSETGEQVVVYQALYGTFQLYVRPYSSFISQIDKNKYPDCKQAERFELIERESLLSNISETVESFTTEIRSDTSGLKIENTEQYLKMVDEQNQEGEVNPHLLAFLEADTYEEKLAVLVAARPEIDDQLINAMAVSLDVVIPEGEIKDRFIGFKNCLETFRKYECNRFPR